MFGRPNQAGTPRDDDTVRSEVNEHGAFTALPASLTRHFTLPLISSARFDFANAPHPRTPAFPAQSFLRKLQLSSIQYESPDSEKR